MCHAEWQCLGIFWHLFWIFVGISLPIFNLFIERYSGATRWSRVHIICGAIWKGMLVFDIELYGKLIISPSLGAGFRMVVGTFYISIIDLL